MRKREARAHKRRQSHENARLVVFVAVARGEREADTPTPQGNSDGYQSKGDAETWIYKNMITRAIKIDDARKTPWVGEVGRGETGALSAEP